MDDLSEVSRGHIPLGGVALIAPPGPLSAGDLWRFVGNCQLIALAAQQSPGEKIRVLLVQRLDGFFGFGPEASPLDPAQGALAGLAKTLRHESPHACVKAVDVSPMLSAFAAAEMLAAEWFSDGPLEVGLSEAGRTGLALSRIDGPNSIASVHVGPNDLLLVTGGARGVTAAVAKRLIDHGARRFIILGRTPTPAPEQPWLATLASEAAIKRGLLEHSPNQLTLREMQRAYETLMAAREVAVNIDALRALGAEVHYVSVDLRRSDEVFEKLTEYQRRLGPITGLIHGAGVLADRRIEDLTEEDFHRVYATKMDGIRNVWATLDPARLKWCMLFSSITARLGRGGQAAYAMANEALNKFAQSIRRDWPQCRVQAVNWGPWEGGMVRGGLKDRFLAEGIGLIPLEGGAELLCQEMLAAEFRPTELVVLASTPESSSHLSEAEITISVTATPLLNDHRLSGRPVVPLAVALEWLAAEAQRRFPDWRVSGFRDVQVLSGITLHDDGPVPLRIRAEAPSNEPGVLALPLVLATTAPSGNQRPRIRATVLLDQSDAEFEAPVFPTTDWSNEGANPPDYHSELFHGPVFQMIDEVHRCDTQGISVRAKTAVGHRPWNSLCGSSPRIVDPVILDAVFQSLVIWSQRERGLPALPTAIRHFRQHPDLLHQRAVHIITSLTKEQGPRLTADVAILSVAGRCLGTLTDCEWVASPSLRAAFAAAPTR